MAKIGDMFGLSTGAIALIAKAHGASRGVRRFDPLKVRKAIRLIDRGMPVSHAAQIVGLRADSLMITWKSAGCMSARRAATGHGPIGNTRRKHKKWAPSGRPESAPVSRRIPLFALISRQDLHAYGRTAREIISLAVRHIDPLNRAVAAFEVERFSFRAAPDHALHV